MMLKPPKKKTIKEWAHAYLLRVNYTDINGRGVGFDYGHILTKLKETFPHANTSHRWLLKMAYELNGVARLPVRRRSRKILARDFARSLLVEVDGQGNGLPYNTIRRRVKARFPDLPIMSIFQIQSIESQGVRAGHFTKVKVPERRDRSP